MSEIIFAKKKYGNEGSSRTLKANFFSLTFSRKEPIFHYNINISKPEDEAAGKTANYKIRRIPKHINDMVFNHLFQNFKEFKTKILPVFDGEKNFYSLTKFDLKAPWKKEVQVEIGQRKQKFIVDVTIPEISHGQNFANLTGKNCEMTPVEQQALDIVMRYGSRFNKVQIGNDFYLKHNDKNFDPIEIKEDDMHYVAFGRYQCSKLSERSVLYNVDRAMGIFIYGGNLKERIAKILRRYSNDPNFCQELFKEKNLVERHLRGLKFNLVHLPGRKVEIFKGLTECSISDIKFNIKSEDGSVQTSVFEYFEKTYPKYSNILDPTLPCVIARSGDRQVFYPIECVELAHDEIFRGKLPKRIQGQVTTTSSRQFPAKRFKCIEEHVKTLKIDSNVKSIDKTIDYLKEFGISINVKPIEVKGRVLSAPSILYSKNEFSQAKYGSWNPFKKIFFNTIDVGKNWAIINVAKYSGEFNYKPLNTLCFNNTISSLIRSAKEKGINLEKPKFSKQNFDYPSIGGLNESLRKLEKFYTDLKSFKFIIFCIPDDEAIYNEIKTLFEIEYGIVTQVLNQNNLKKQMTPKNDKRNSDQMVSNTILKINAKIGGTNHSLATKPKILDSKKVMIMGLDVTHPTAGSSIKHSIAACVGTYTENYDKCFNRVKLQEKPGKEIVVDLKEITATFLKQYQAHNNYWPEKIIVYRDGIGEGDFKNVISKEFASIKKAISEQCGINDIKITFIIVQKRHNSRFLPSFKPQDFLNLKISQQNVEAGTVVDSEVTSHKLFEFYLCSHTGMMGTSRPTKYVVLKDENNFTADEVQIATYNLCYLYPRCNKAISIPPTVAYAHLLAKRGRSYLGHFMKMDKIDQLSGSQIGEYNAKMCDSRIKNLNGRLFFI